MTDQRTLSLPAQSVVIVPGMTLDQAIEAERRRRDNLDREGQPYHYWQARGDGEPPSAEHWCNRCIGFYGVPHDSFTHTKGAYCRSLGMYQDCRQCACLECVVHEAWRSTIRG